MWGQNWGQLIWGSGRAVPALSQAMLLVVAFALLFIGYRVARKPRSARFWSFVGAGAAIVIPVALAQASNVVVPFLFTNGTTADATQVNQNLAALASAINGLRTQTVVTSECEFRSRLSSTVTLCAQGTGGASIFNNSDSIMVGPVHVPAGALITGMEVVVGDTDPNANISVCMTGVNENIANFDLDPSRCVSTSGVPGDTTRLSLNFAFPLQQGNRQTFELFVISKNNAGGFINWPVPFGAVGLSIRAAYIRYETP